jgi:uncharacterized protein
MDFILPLKALLVITLVHTIGAGLQGSVGYGMALLSGPILVLFEPKLMPGPYLLSSIVLSVLMVLRERRQLVMGDLIWAIGGRIPGSILAASLLALLAAQTINYSFGILILLGVGLSLSGLRFPPNRVNLFIAGVLSGIMGTIAAIGGPPIAIVYQDVPGGRLRTNMSVFFVFGTMISIISLIPAGKMGVQELLLSLNLLPAIFIGYFLSNYLVKLLKPRWLRSAVLGVAGISAAIIIIRQIFT